MAILIETDKPTYFPTVTATGAALTGLLQLAQGIVEGPKGADRRLEIYNNVETTRVAGLLTRCSLLPVVALQAVEVRYEPGGYSRYSMPLDGWRWGQSIPPWRLLTSDEYQLDITGQIIFAASAYEARVSYTTGFDFTTTAPDVVRIKAVMGLVATHLFTNRPGLDSYLENPPTGTTVSYNYASLDSHLTAILMPVRKYLPLSYGG